MNILIDDYHISTNDGGYLKVCIDGQNIIHDRANCFTRKDIVGYSVNAIEKYNERHNLKWGELD